MAERVYLISVTATGMTSSWTDRSEDLFDACTKARELQKRGVEHITIVLNALPQTMQDEYRETFDA